MFEECMYLRKVQLQKVENEHKKHRAILEQKI